MCYGGIMITGGYTLDLICDCEKCKVSTDSHEIKTGEFTGENYAECARIAKNNGWKLSRDRLYCSAPGHSKFERDD
ncbi:hypothetical protein ACX10_02535 [Vibrio parahaemolyticus]|nr:hypothetical protein ACX10_02535 [Vibrio parahaemolyticus]